MPSARVTMKQLAARARVHPSTVSRALRGAPEIPEPTRRRIVALAQKLHFRPDPALAALNAYRRTVRPRAYQATIALVGVGLGGRLPAGGSWLDLYRRGAMNRAEALGYRTGFFHLPPDDPAAAARLADALQARRIAGVLLLSLPLEVQTLPFPWEQFACVTFGFSLAKPSLHRVSSNHFGAMVLALKRLHELGYRRPGLVLTHDTDSPERHGATSIPRLWEGAYLTEAPRLFAPPLPPVCYAGRAEERGVLEWIEHWRPDVVISQIPHLSAVLAQSGWAVPERIAVALTHVDGTPGAAGLRQSSPEIGATAVDLLTGMLHRHEIGVPDHPVHVLVEARWQDGPSAPPRRAHSHAPSASM